MSKLSWLGLGTKTYGITHYSKDIAENGADAQNTTGLALEAGGKVGNAMGVLGSGIDAAAGISSLGSLVTNVGALSGLTVGGAALTSLAFGYSAGTMLDDWLDLSGEAAGQGATGRSIAEERRLREDAAVDPELAAKIDDRDQLSDMKNRGWQEAVARHPELEGAVDCDNDAGIFEHPLERDLCAGLADRGRDALVADKTEAAILAADTPADASFYEHMMTQATAGAQAEAEIPTALALEASAAEVEEKKSEGRVWNMLVDDCLAATGQADE